MRRGIYKHILQHAPSVTGKVLDFGCGQKPCADLFQGASEIIGVDVAVSGHDHKDSSIDVFYNGAKLPFPDSVFDSVTSFEVFEHVFNLDEVLTELERVMVDGGFMLLTIPFAIGEHEQPFDHARYTSYGIADILKNHNFTIRCQQKIGSYPEALCQLLINYLLQTILPNNFVVRGLATLTIIAPLAGFSVLLGKMLPKDCTLYTNQIILAQKERIDNCQ